MDNNSWMTAKGTQTMQYRSDRHVGTVRHPYVIELTDDMSLDEICPMPWIDVLNIRFDVDETADVDVAIFDVQGRLMANFNDCNDAGHVQLQWDDVTCQRGEYILRISINGKVYAFKVIKI